MKLRFIIFFAFCSFSCQYSFAQSMSVYELLMKASIEDEVVRIILKDTNQITGKVESLSFTSTKIISDNGTFLIRLDKIQEAFIYNPNNKTSHWYDNPAQNKLFITPSGRMLKPGNGYYQNTYIFFSTLSYGLSEYLTVSGSVSTLPKIGARYQLLSFSVKYGSNINRNISLSGTASYNTFGGFIRFGTLYTAGTYTKGRSDLSAGVGMVFSSEGNTKPIMILGGQLRVSEGFALISENVVITSSFTGALTFGSVGGRFIGKKIAADMGVFTGSGIEAFIPFTSFTVKL